MTGNDDQLRIKQAVREALDAIVGPSVRDALIRAALRAAGHAHVPVDRESAVAFVRGPLRLEVTRTLGPEFADTVAEEIGRLLGSMAPPSAKPRRASRSGEHRGLRSTPPKAPSRSMPKHRPSRESAPRRSLSPQPVASRIRRARSKLPPLPPLEDDRKTPPVAGPAPEHMKRAVAELTATESGPITIPPRSRRKLPFVMLATTDETLSRELSAFLDLRAALVPVKSVFELVNLVENAAGATLLVVLDCRNPSIRPTALAALADELTNHQVMLWGATKSIEELVLQISPNVCRWICSDEDEEPRELAKRCVSLVS